MSEQTTVASLVPGLKAAGEPTRLRILAILEHHELTVTELVQILGQSQPRVSRHLRVLCEAGLLRRQAEGTSAFYRLDRTSDLAPLVTSLLGLLDPTDVEVARDAQRLRRIRTARASRAAGYFEQVASSWDRMRGHHVPEAEIEAALVELLRGREIASLVDLGTGTGRILEIAAPHIGSGVGVDTSRDMLAVARDKLERGRLHHCQVRHGDIYHLDLPDGSVDAAVVHHVLHFLDEPADAIAEAARILGPGGLLVIVDFAPHGLELLREEYEHVRLGFSTDEIDEWCIRAGLGEVRARTFLPDAVDDQTLPVTLWTALQPVDATSGRVTHPLEVA